jgi:hypothetical protein
MFNMPPEKSRLIPPPPPLDPISHKLLIPWPQRFNEVK